MKYLQKYIPFYEAGGLKMSETITRYLPHSPAMNDIMALVSGEMEATEPFFKVKKEGSLVYNYAKYNRFFGQTINAERHDDGTYTYKANENSKLSMQETVEDLEACLRHIWAFIVSRQKKFKLTTNYDKETTRKILLDSNKRPYWGQKKNLTEILNGIGDVDFSQIDMDEVRYKLIDLYEPLGIIFGKKAIEEKNGITTGGEITMPSDFGKATGKRDNLLHLILKGIFGKEGGQGGTYDRWARETSPMYFTLTKEYQKDDSYQKFIQPRTTEEAILQCIYKLAKYYKYTCKDYKQITFAGETTTNLTIKSFIIYYSLFLADEIKKIGYHTFSEKTFDTLVYKAAINMPETYNMVNLIKTHAPEYWDKIKDFDSEGLTAAADMDSIGF